jgi:hypothetical protein
VDVTQAALIRLAFNVTELPIVSEVEATGNAANTVVRFNQLQVLDEALSKVHKLSQVHDEVEDKLA